MGKTTCAAAWAVGRAEAGARVLAISTDPAHSLGDALAARLGMRPIRIRLRAGRLDAVELDAASAVTRWLRPRRPAIAGLLERGTLLDREDVTRVLEQPLPGIDELAGFLTLAGLERSRQYDEVVLDTAPTGHTLRLFDTPRLVERIADFFESLFARHATVVRAFGGSLERDAFLDELRRDGEAVASRLRDAERTAIAWVTLPEPVTVGETIDGIAWLRRGGFPIAAVVVNRATLDAPAGCRECRARVATERDALAPLAREARSIAVRLVSRQAREPRGIPALRAVAAELRVTRPWNAVVARGGRTRVPRVRARLPGAVPGLAALSRATGLILFGGKGGVGKTTCAAALALATARAQPARRVRLVSTDPAPSLGDVLQLRVGDQWRAVPGRWRLEVRELDAPALFASYRARYRQAIDEFFDRLTGGAGISIETDREVFERLFDLAPPGIDEVMALLSAIDLEQNGDELLIVDTAPTGHTVRLLGLPADAQQWVALLMRLVIRYRLAARAERLATDLLRMSRGLRGLRERLSDPSRARFVTVVRPGALPRLETERLLDDLRALSISSPTLILNAMTAGTCEPCAAIAREEGREAARIRRLCMRAARRGARPGARGGCDIIQAPLEIPPPRGARDLLDWAGAWRG